MINLGLNIVIMLGVPFLNILNVPFIFYGFVLAILYFLHLYVVKVLQSDWSCYFAILILSSWLKFSLPVFILHSAETEDCHQWVYTVYWADPAMSFLFLSPTTRVDPVVSVGNFFLFSVSNEEAFYAFIKSIIQTWEKKVICLSETDSLLNMITST